MRIKICRLKNFNLNLILTYKMFNCIHGTYVEQAFNLHTCWFCQNFDYCQY